MEDRANILRAMKICRFCLNESDTLTNIYERPKKDSRQFVPLPLQIMACVSIEVFENDGMPQMICHKCKALTLQAYNFKTNCKKADDALKLFVATGSLVKPFTKHDFEHYLPGVSPTNVRKEVASKPIADSPPSKRFKPDEEIITVNFETPASPKDDSQEVPVQEGENENIRILGLSEDSQNDDSQNSDSSQTEQKSPRNNVVQVQTDCFPCPHCDRSFPLKQLLDIHKANHERERSFFCDECGRRFYTKYDLSKHLQTHSDEKPFSCVICGKKFLRESLLHRHEKIHNDAPKYLCEECDKPFLTKEDLNIHMVRHRKKRPHQCKICSKSFVFKQGLERHELTHKEQKPHKCNYCEASFNTPIKLTRHVTSHAGLRPYPCKLCGRTFLLSHHLTRHMRNHYASRNSQAIGQYKCDICSMSFRRKDSLINHSAIHSMVNLKCVICNTEFSSAQKVKEHITTHLSGLPFPCEKCDYSFDTKEQLEEHEIKHAEMEYENEIEKEVAEEVMRLTDNQEDVQQSEGDADGEAESEEEEVAEFTITNDSMDNPQIVRRSKRNPKVKTYVDFLQDDVEIGEAEMELQENNELDDKDFVPGESQAQAQIPSSQNEENVIKPIVRPEGTRVYKRKTSQNIDKPKLLNPLAFPTMTKLASLEEITEPQITTIENLGITSQELTALPTEKFVNMKIGNKTVRVQKLVLTKEEMRAMAKQGKIKGNTIVIKNPVNMPLLTSTPKPQVLQQVNVDDILSNSSNKSVVKKTYQRKSVESDQIQNEQVLINENLQSSSQVIATNEEHNN